MLLAQHHTLKHLTFSLGHTACCPTLRTPLGLPRVRTAQVTLERGVTLSVPLPSTCGRPSTWSQRPTPDAAVFVVTPAAMSVRVSTCGGASWDTVL